MSNPGKLPIPTACALDSEALEVLSVWVTNRNEPSISIQEVGWEDPAFWGILLADIARVAAKQYPSRPEYALKRIAASFNVDIEEADGE